MYYLYGQRAGSERRLVATFDSEQQLLAYVRWATLSQSVDGSRKFEQGSVLVGYTAFEHTSAPPDDGSQSDVAHNPTPSML